MSKRLIYLFLLYLVITVTTGATKADIGNGLVGYWKFDESSGMTAADSAGRDNDGTLSIEVSWTTGKIHGGVLYGGQSPAHIEVPTTGMSALVGTVAMWVYLYTPQPSQTRYFFGHTTQPAYANRIQLYMDGGDTELDLGLGDSHISRTGIITLEIQRWYHVGVTWDNSNYNVYVDGVAMAQGTYTGLMSLHPFAWIGNDGNPVTDGTQGFGGILDEVRIYNRVLTQVEIQQVMIGTPGAAFKPSPANYATDVNRDIVLNWTPGRYASPVNGHKVFFSESFKDVNDGIDGIAQDANSYTPAQSLELGTTYYWRVDEVNGPPDYTVYQGDVWSFTVAQYLVVDDFEDYNDRAPDQIFNTWIDGWLDPANGSQVGYLMAPYAELDIVHWGDQAMPYFYDNNFKYSEATMTLDLLRDWAEPDVAVLSLWFKGHLPYFGSFVEQPTGNYMMTGLGADISGTSDQLHFAYKQLSTAGTIVAKVESVENTHEWTKAGVMVRDTLDPGSAQAMVAITPCNGVWFGYREKVSGDIVSAKQTGIAAPQWLKLEHTTGGFVSAYYSADGITWMQLHTPQRITMNIPVYMGLALSSHDAALMCEARFSNVSFPNTSVGPEWTNQDIGIISNAPTPMYAAIANSNGYTAVVYHDDPNAVLIHTWTEWLIGLEKIADQGVDLTNVDKLSIGFGDKNNVQAGGSGLVFFDDIRLYRLVTEPEMN